MPSLHLGHCGNDSTSLFVWWCCAGDIEVFIRNDQLETLSPSAWGEHLGSDSTSSSRTDCRAAAATNAADSDHASQPTSDQFSTSNGGADPVSFQWDSLLQNSPPGSTSSNPLLHRASLPELRRSSSSAAAAAAAAASQSDHAVPHSQSYLGNCVGDLDDLLIQLGVSSPTASPRRSSHHSTAAAGATEQAYLPSSSEPASCQPAVSLPSSTASSLSGGAVVSNSSLFPDGFHELSSLAGSSPIGQPTAANQGLLCSDATSRATSTPVSIPASPQSHPQRSAFVASADSPPETPPVAQSTPGRYCLYFEVVGHSSLAQERG